MTKLLFVDHTPFAGGGQLVLAEHIAALDKQEFQPHVACTADVPDLVHRYESAGAIVHILDLPRLRGWQWQLPWRLMHSLRQLRQVITGNNIDVVIANTTRASYLVFGAGLGLKVPVIWWVRDFLYPKRVFSWLQHQPKHIICVSQAIARYYGIAGSSRTSVLYVASSLYKDLEKVTAHDRQQERAKYGLTASDIVVGFMGRLVSEKGAEDVVAAVAHLSKDYPRLKLLIVGTGAGQMHDIEPQLRQSVTTAGLEATVAFAGYQVNQALYYSLFDIFVLATRDAEPFATSVVQAMMAGAAVIGSNAGGTPELVVDGQTGLLYTPAEVPDLMAAIQKLLDDPKLAKILAQAGHDQVLQYHQEEQLARQAEAIYRQVLQQSRQGVS